MTELILLFFGLVYLIFPIVVSRRLQNIENLLIIQNKYLAKLEEWHRFEHEANAQAQSQTPCDPRGIAPPTIAEQLEILARHGSAVKLITIFALVFPLAAQTPSPPSGERPGVRGFLQTNSAPFRYAGVEFTTNWFAEHPEWRASQGVIYNTKAANTWSWKTGKVIEATNGLALVEYRWKQDRYYIEPGYSYGGRGSGNFLGGGHVPARRVKIGEDEKVERFLFTNARPELERGWKIDTTPCTYLDAAIFRGEVLPLYDCGTTPTQSEIDALRVKLKAR